MVRARARCAGRIPSTTPAGTSRYPVAVVRKALIVPYDRPLRRETKRHEGEHARRSGAGLLKMPVHRHDLAVVAEVVGHVAPVNQGIAAVAFSL